MASGPQFIWHGATPVLLPAAVPAGIRAAAADLARDMQAVFGQLLPAAGQRFGDWLLRALEPVVPVIDNSSGRFRDWYRDDRKIGIRDLVSRLEERCDIR